MTKVMALTVTHKLRLFRARSGQVVAPWSSVEEVMDHLYGLLYAWQEQESLWADLAVLLDSIQSETRCLLTAPDAEILSQSRVDALVAELRRALRASAEAPAAGAMRRFALGKNVGVLACLALLTAGFSLGCGPRTSHADGRSAVAPSPPVHAASSGSGDQAAPIASTSGDALMDLFRDDSPADIAAELEASLSAKPKEPKHPKHPKHPGTPVPVYKGISFPTDRTE
jgi:hypothetical protein